MKPLFYVASLAYRIPSQRIIDFFAPWEAEVSGRRIGKILALDTLEGIDSLDEIARRVDILLFSKDRRGFGRAKSAVLGGALPHNPEGILIADCDGQYSAADLKSFFGFFVQNPDHDYYIGQRSAITLPSDGEITFSRHLAELFENYALARIAGQTSLEFTDLQTGAVIFRKNAMEFLFSNVESTDFSWDMNACHLLLPSAFRRAFPAVRTFPQTSSAFVEEDGIRKLQFFIRMGYRDRLIGYYEHFANEESVQSRFSQSHIARFKEFLAKVISGV